MYDQEKKIKRSKSREMLHHVFDGKEKETPQWCRFFLDRSETEKYMVEMFRAATFVVCRSNSCGVGSLQ